MEEPDIEGITNHDDPESCAVAREGGGEAWTGARAGRVFSREIRNVWGADAVMGGGRQHAEARYLVSGSAALRGPRPLACTESPCARTGRSLYRSSRWRGGTHREGERHSR
jgi:hypothetical protein